MRGEDNRTSSLFLKCIRHLLDSLPYCFGIKSNLSLSKNITKDISYTPLYTIIISLRYNLQTLCLPFEHIPVHIHATGSYKVTANKGDN
ncbi:hypothetical protein H8356DRAFT_1428052 [Neocallimastix lanati (nom. inval.)]|nr:hypothetical protein H8356DRAFT_1428052 [Neocallimastix sp. JGI-2020a]